MSYAGVDYDDSYYLDKARDTNARLEKEIERLERKHKRDLKKARADALRDARNALTGDDECTERVRRFLTKRAASGKA